MIEVSGLTAHTAASAVLLDGVDLTMRAGTVTALVGPSGSGKTTTALALLGEAPPGVRLSGAVQVAGIPVVDGTGPTPAAAGVRGGTVAYLPQHPGGALNPARRVGAVLTELARLHADPETGGGRQRRRDARRRATDALLGAQLPPERGVLRRFPHQFSGGQRQRVALAKALACGPRALILDEPSTGLDTVTRLGLARELGELARKGIAILLLSHDHALVRALADHVVLLENGRVVAAGGAGLLPSGDSTAPLAASARDGSPRAAGPAAATAETGRTGAAAGAVEPVTTVGHTPSAGSGSGSDGTVVNGAGQRPTPPLLDVHGLSAYLRSDGRGEVLHDVSLGLAAGECLAIVGRSGSGKTTLARCVAGLHERWQGRMRLDGAELPVLRHRDTERRRRVQYVWQEARGSFDERRTVLEQVARTGVRLRGLAPSGAVEEAVGLLCRLGVSERVAERPAGSLSGGELQRAAFARATLAHPNVLVCDEITTALDARAAGLVLDEVERMRCETGTAVLWIGHDLAPVRALAHRLLVLDGGRIVEQGDCRKVLAAPRAEATRLLLEAEHLGSRRKDGGEPSGRAGTTIPPGRTGHATGTRPRRGMRDSSSNRQDHQNQQNQQKDQHQQEGTP
nr:ATP-binding cassette domain-containing protein [Streptomyces sp. TS71-3]